MGRNGRLYRSVNITATQEEYNDLKAALYTLKGTIPGNLPTADITREALTFAFSHSNKAGLKRFIEVRNAQKA
jgi:hypothetical protein